MDNKIKIAAWKKWLSHVYPVSLEVTGSEENDYLEVVLSKGRLQLVANEAIYSWDDLYDNFTTAFKYIKVTEHPPKTVLVLGLGLGSVPFILEKTFGVQADYTAVEWDEEVVYLASKYSLPRLSSRIDCQIGDAEAFVYTCSETFDMVCMDVFEGDITPPQFETEEFLEALASLLNSGGTLLYNCLYCTPEDEKRTNRFWRTRFKPTFPEANFAKSKGNHVLIYKKS